MTLISHLLLYGIKIFSPNNFNNTSKPQKEKLISRKCAQTKLRDRLIYFMQFHTNNSRRLWRKKILMCALLFVSTGEEVEGFRTGHRWHFFLGWRSPLGGWCKTVYVFTFCCHFGALSHVRPNIIPSGLGTERSVQLSEKRSAVKINWSK